jgi:hypothetical protein
MLARRSGRRRAADHAERQSFVVVSGERCVAAIKGLVGDLPAGGGIVAPVTGVDDGVAVVLVVLVAAGDDDRIRALGGGTGNARLQWPVYAGVVSLTSGREACALGDTGNLAEPGRG